MSSTQHHSLTEADIHALTRWTVADTAARLALSLIEADNNKLCKQLDNSSYWMLVDYAGPTWVEFTSVGVAAVTSVFGQIGDVDETDASFTASQIANVAAGNLAATDVQAAINELDGEKAGTVHAHTLSEVSDSGTAAAQDVGTGVGDVPQLEDIGGGTPGLPAVDGSQLTGVAGGGSAITVEDDGTPLTTDVTKFNFAGAVTLTEPVADEITVTITPGSAPVASVFTRTGAVLPEASDYNASQIDNNATNANGNVTGAYVSGALDTADAAIEANTTAAAAAQADATAAQADATSAKTKTDFLTVTQTVNLDTVESDTATNNTKRTYPVADETMVDSHETTLANVGTPITAAGAALLDDLDAAAQRTTMGLGTAAVENVGVTIGDAVQLENVGGNPGMPAVDGSQLTGLTSSGAIDVEEAGVPKVTDATTMNFTGGGVTVVDAGGGEATVTIAPGAAPVDTVFGRTGTVAAAASDYDASQVDNDSSVLGGTSTVAAALTQLDTDITNKTVDVLSNVASGVILGRDTVGSGNSEELTPAEAAALLDHAALGAGVGTNTHAQIDTHITAINLILPNDANVVLSDTSASDVGPGYNIVSAGPSMEIHGGDSSQSAGGGVVYRGGDSDATAGGNVTVRAGDGAAADGGDLTIRAGVSTGAGGGDLSLNAGTGSVSDGNVSIATSGGNVTIGTNGGDLTISSDATSITSGVVNVGDGIDDASIAPVQRSFTGTNLTVAGGDTNTADAGGNLVLQGGDSGSGTDGAVHIGQTLTSAVEVATTGVTTTINGPLQVDETVTLTTKLAADNLAGWTHSTLQDLTPDAGTIFASLQTGQVEGLADVAAATGQKVPIELNGVTGAWRRVDMDDLLPNTANVTAAGALMDSEVDADIKTLSLPASTTISAFGATLVDDADEATARTTLGVAPITGAGAPGASTGNGRILGTIYVDTTNDLGYTLSDATTDANVWSAGGGTTILTGAVDPTTEGSAGDFYYNTVKQGFWYNDTGTWEEVGVVADGTTIEVDGGTGQLQIVAGGVTGTQLAAGAVANSKLADDAVTYAKMQNVAADDVFLGNNAGAGGVVAELNAAAALAILGVESGADVTDTENVAESQVVKAGGGGPESVVYGGGAQRHTAQTITTNLTTNGIVICSAATFVADGVLPGDACHVTSTGNNGVFEVVSVDSETQITLNETFAAGTTGTAQCFAPLKEGLISARLNATGTGDARVVRGAELGSNSTGVGVIAVNVEATSTGHALAEAIYPGSSVIGQVSNASTGRANLETQAPGAIAAGEIDSTSTGITKISSHNFTWGKVEASGTVGASLSSGAAGALAAGYANASTATAGVSASGEGAAAVAKAVNAVAEASGTGATLHGHANGNAMTASGDGSGVWGDSTAGPPPQASATNSFQFGCGWNAEANSLQVGNPLGQGIRLNAGGAAPSSNLHNGDVWVATDDVIIRSGDTSVNVTSLGAGGGGTGLLGVWSCIANTGTPAADEFKSGSGTETKASISQLSIHENALKGLSDNGLFLSSSGLKPGDQILVQNTADPLGDLAVYSVGAAAPTLAGSVYLCSGLTHEGSSGSATLTPGDDYYIFVRKIPKTTRSKSLTVPNPTASDDKTMFWTPVAITLKSAHGVTLGASTTWTVQIYHDVLANRGTGIAANLFAMSMGTAGNSYNLINGDLTVPANSWVWIKSSAMTGTPTEGHITVTYTEDA